VTISNITAHTSILVMLSNDACSPCYIFNDSGKSKTRLSPVALRDILLWAANTETETPEVFFLAGTDEPLESSIASILEDMSDQVITPLLPIDQQESQGIPFSTNQTTIASSLEQIIAYADDIAGRPIILHIEQREIGMLAKSLLSIQDSIGTIRLCLHNIHLLDDHDFKTYEQQLASIADVGFMKQATGVEGRFRLLNLNVLDLTKNQNPRCPAGTGFIVISPDGHIYPCPAFYYAGKEPIGSIHNTAKKLAALSWNQQKCGICSSTQCPGCPFIESSQLTGREQICRVYEIEKRVTQKLLPRIAQSGYLFDCLRILKTRNCSLKSKEEGGESFIVGQQVHSVTYDEFVKALHDLKLAAGFLANKSSNGDDYNTVLNRWMEIPEIPSSSQRSIFRRRVLETLMELNQLKDFNSLVNQNKLSPQI